MQKVFILAVCILVTSCGSVNSDGSDATTYTSCSITSSEALLAGDRASDVAQCWDGLDYKEKSLALTWCTQQVTTYIGARYIFGHAVQYTVASTNCP